VDDKKYRNLCIKEISKQTRKDVSQNFLKELDALNKKYNYRIIYDVIVYSANSIEWALTHKNFTSDYGEARYLFAIYNNNIDKIPKNINDKVSLHTIDTDVNLNIIGVSNKNNDVSTLLGDL